LLGSQEIQFGACDSDGILGAVDIDWGDGSPHGTVTGNRYGCGYPGPVGGATHTYPGPGTYTITAVATSVDDQGQAAQHSQPTSTDVKVNADGTYGAG
jgi:hypothetical protein